MYGEMKYTDSLMILRTRKGNTVSCHMVYTHNYRKMNPKRFDYKGYSCNHFELLENVGGNVIVKCADRLEHANIDFENVIKFANVTEIEIMSEHDL